jgi:hypothetical protein
MVRGNRIEFDSVVSHNLTLDMTYLCSEMNCSITSENLLRDHGNAVMLHSATSENMNNPTEIKHNYFVQVHWKSCKLHLS